MYASKQVRFVDFVGGEVAVVVDDDVVDYNIATYAKYAD